jgi:hypothetical protein
MGLVASGANPLKVPTIVLPPSAADPGRPDQAAAASPRVAPGHDPGRLSSMVAGLTHPLGPRSAFPADLTPSDPQQPRLEACPRVRDRRQMREFVVGLLTTAALSVEVPDRTGGG